MALLRYSLNEVRRRLHAGPARTALPLVPETPGSDDPSADDAVPAGRGAAAHPMRSVPDQNRGIQEHTGQ